MTLKIPDKLPHVEKICGYTCNMSHSCGNSYDS